MIFSDNVSIEQERALKEEARERNLLVMGPDCGTAILGGVPLGFANAIPRGGIGAVSASGTGLQEFSVLVARAGQGLSHGIGVGGRDLRDEVGGISTLMALDALEDDAETRTVALISKPPGARAAAQVMQRLGRSRKRCIACFLGHDRPAELPAGVGYATTLREAARGSDRRERISPHHARFRTTEIPDSALRIGARVVHHFVIRDGLNG
jgi:FdrA protein